MSEVQDRRKRCRIYSLYAVLKAHAFVILDSSMVEHSAVNRRVVGSSPTRGVKRKPAINKLPFLITFLAPWSSGQDIALSRR